MIREEDYASLLGRVPSEPDDRNYPLSVFLEKESVSELDASLAALLQSHASVATKRWAKIVTSLLDQNNPMPTPDPTPTPTPSNLAIEWHDSHQLDQGQTGHCVGFSAAQFLNTLGSENKDDSLTDADGHAFYYACKVIDGEPKKENGSSIHTAAKMLKARGSVNAYAWAANVNEVAQWVTTKGPMHVGTDWMKDMFQPDANGVVRPTGTVAGGHAYIVVGYDPARDMFKFQNSWGPDWGANGYFYMTAADFETLLNAQGEACTEVELA